MSSIVAVIPSDAIAGVVGALLVSLVWLTRVLWKLSERLVRLEQRFDDFER